MYVGIDIVGGPQVSSRQFVFGTNKKIRSEFHVTYCSDSRESESLFLPPPPSPLDMVPPTLARFIHLRAEGSMLVPVLEKSPYRNWVVF